MEYTKFKYSSKEEYDELQSLQSVAVLTLLKDATLKNKKSDNDESEETIKEKAKSFFDKFLPDLNRQIAHYSPESREKLNVSLRCFFYDNLSMIEKINSETSSEDITNLPIKIGINDDFSRLNVENLVSERLLFLLNKEFLPIEIALDSFDDFNLTVRYIKQLTDILLLGGSFNKTSFIHAEMISLFLEKLACLELSCEDNDLFIEGEIHTWKKVTYNPEFENLILCGYDKDLIKLFKSNMMALELLLKYTNSSEEIKNAILKDIQDVLNMQMTLDDFIEKNKISVLNESSAIASIKSIDLSVEKSKKNIEYKVNS